MTGLDSRIRSPSTFRRTLRTPCVLGCWGPRLISISVVWNMRVSSDCLAVQLVIAFLALERVLLAQGIADPVVRQEDPREVRMSHEADGDHVRDCPLLTVRLPP